MNVMLSESQQNFLDVFRIIAAAGVMVGHSFSFYQVTPFKDEAYFPYIQNIGVVMFFLLSGFLTTFSIMKRNKDGFCFYDFFIHKFLRINKEYLPGLAMIAVIDYLSIIVNGNGYRYYDALNIKQFLANALMLQNMGPNGILGNWFVPFGSGRPLWTLSVEWWLYMLFGALFITIINQRLITARNMALIGLFLFMSCNYLITGRGNGLGTVFMLGVGTYYIYNLQTFYTAKCLLVISVLLYIIYGLFIHDAYTIYSFVLLWLMFTAMLKYCGYYNWKRSNVLSFMSKSTFMLYIIHYSVIDLFFSYNGSLSVCWNFALGIIFSIILSGLAYFVIIQKNILGVLWKFK